MTKNNVTPFENREITLDPLMDLVKKGARELIHNAVELELQELLSIHSFSRTPEGNAAVVRNGYHPEREIQTGIGPISVKIPKIRSRTGEPVTFHSALVPPYVRKAKSLEAAIPWLYLKGISSGEMANALEVLVGHEAKGLSASTVSRLKQKWGKEYELWRDRSIKEDEWVYIYADGIHSGLRGDGEKLCALVIIGVNTQGKKKFLAIEDGTRESTQSWREVLLRLKEQGMNIPKLAIGDGALGFWAALDEIYPDTKQQRCWVHKMENILNCMPKSLQDKARGDLRDIWLAESKKEAEKAFDLFVKTYEDKYLKATENLQKNHQELLTFYDFPALHWQSIRTSNPIESAFATIRHRTKRSKGCLSKAGMLHMMFKLGQCAEKRWYKIRGFEDLDKIVKGVIFIDGIEQEVA